MKRYTHLVATVRRFYFKRLSRCLRNNKHRIYRESGDTQTPCIMQGALLEQLDVASVWQIFDAVALGYAEACASKQGSSGVPVSPDSRGRASKLSMPILSPQAWLFLLCLYFVIAFAPLCWLPASSELHDHCQLWVCFAPWSHCLRCCCYNLQPVRPFRVCLPNMTPVFGCLCVFSVLFSTCKHLPCQERKREEKFMLFSNHNGSLPRRKPGAYLAKLYMFEQPILCLCSTCCEAQAWSSRLCLHYIADSARAVMQEVEVKVLRWLHEEEATGVQYLEVPHPCCILVYLTC